MHHPTDRIAHTTAFVTPVVERKIAYSHKMLISLLINMVSVLYMYIYIGIDI